MNGFTMQYFITERGLRQGDLLFSFLFFIYAKVFSTLIRRVIADQRLKGLRMGKETSETTHLFFTDDSLLFMKANFTFKMIFKDYEDVSS